MAANSRISWTDRTWNPLLGCERVSPGCDGCYAIREANMHAGHPNPKISAAFAGLTRRDVAGALDWTGQVNLLEPRLSQPLKWREPSRVFVNSQSDLFHDAVPNVFIAEVFAVMAAAHWHTFQLLTKRHGRMRSLLKSRTFFDAVHTAYLCMDAAAPAIRGYQWPLPNVWLGVSVENQQWADIRIPALLATPAAVRWISAEPLLGPVNLKSAALRPYERQQGGYWEYGHGEDVYGNGKIWVPAPPAQLDWVVVGGESGPGARPMHPRWARSLRDQCVAAGVPFHYKQTGEWIEDVTIDDDGTRHINVPRDHRDRNRCAMHPAGMTALTPDNPFNPFSVGHPHWTAMRRVGKKAAGRLLDGRSWDEYPEPAAMPV